MAIPKVVLMGGPPSDGKSAVARCIAARYQYNCIPTNDIRKAVRVANFLRTSSRYNQLMVESAVECGATVIRVKLGYSVEDIANQCVLALVEE